MTFKELNLISPILKAINDEGYEQPSPIQAQAIPPLLEGRDVLGCAQTGTGKTAAFAIPILQKLFKANATKTSGRAVKALILTPTRELAAQVGQSFKTYGRYTGLKTIVMFGGVSQVPQVEELRAGADILVATPGRLCDLINQKICDLSSISFFVLDEADRMLDMGFIADVKKIIALIPRSRQTLLFSATMPKEIAALADTILQKPIKVTVTPVSSPVEIIDQSVYFVDNSSKSGLLLHLLKTQQVYSALVFTRTKRRADQVCRTLNKSGVSAGVIHSDKSQTARQRALAEFAAGKTWVLVATDIAARGIDIDKLTHVFNYNLPEEAEAYVHRIGRTGRAGHEGTAISLCSFDEKPYLESIQKLIKMDIRVEEDNPYPMQNFEPRKPPAPRPPKSSAGSGRRKPHPSTKPNRPSRPSPDAKKHR
ncbi:MAG: DEAD/DEAH box helicase [Oscillospiraceae bacterium]|nr:DEAD/DEAH box helicase [Oscillospiraceae bacterium]